MLSITAVRTVVMLALATVSPSLTSSDSPFAIIAKRKSTSCRHLVTVKSKRAQLVTKHAFQAMIFLMPEFASGALRTRMPPAESIVALILYTDPLSTILFLVVESLPNLDYANHYYNDQNHTYKDKDP